MFRYGAIRIVGSRCVSPAGFLLVCCFGTSSFFLFFIQKNFHCYQSSAFFVLFFFFFRGFTNLCQTQRFKMLKGHRGDFISSLCMYSPSCQWTSMIPQWPESCRLIPRVLIFSLKSQNWGFFQSLEIEIFLELIGKQILNISRVC